MRRFVSFFLVLIAACCGSPPEPKTPTTESADLVRDGSSAPDPTAGGGASLPATETPKSEPVKTSAVSNTADGSDIVPPFTSSPDQDKKAAPKPTKKKKKKKQT